MKRLLFALVALVLAAPALAALNLNTATRDELVALPGIGPSKAQAIVDYRNQHGPFRSVDEIRKVKGIGEKLFTQIKPELSVGAPRAAVSAAKGEVKPEAKADPKSPPRANAGAVSRDDKTKK